MFRDFGAIDKLIYSSAFTGRRGEKKRKKEKREKRKSQEYKEKKRGIPLYATIKCAKFRKRKYCHVVDIFKKFILQFHNTEVGGS